MAYERLEFVLFILMAFTALTNGTVVSDFNMRSMINGALGSYMCRGQNGQLCSGVGSCYHGVCTCDIGYIGRVCEFSTENTHDPTTTREMTTTTELVQPDSVIACIGNNEGVCSGNGVCQNGACVCMPGWSGIVCELYQAKGFCETYRACAECTAFMEACPSKCQIMADFYLVFDFPSGSSTFHRCRGRSASRRCSFYYQLESTSGSGGKYIMVKTCLNYPTPPHMTSTVMSYPNDGDVTTTTEVISTSTRVAMTTQQSSEIETANDHTTTTMTSYPDGADFTIATESTSSPVTMTTQRTSETYTTTEIDGGRTDSVDISVQDKSKGGADSASNRPTCSVACVIFNSLIGSLFFSRLLKYIQT
uniref:Integrin beta n=1 Tax=Solen grandis TaxID=165599 RepID=A0A290G0K9_9BIVA|nr:integrin beta [Solen grandis]